MIFQMDSGVCMRYALAIRATLKFMYECDSAMGEKLPNIGWYKCILADTITRIARGVRLPMDMSIVPAALSYVNKASANLLPSGS